MQEVAGIISKLAQQVTHRLVWVARVAVLWVAGLLPADPRGGLQPLVTQVIRPQPLCMSCHAVCCVCCVCQGGGEGGWVTPEVVMVRFGASGGCGCVCTVSVPVVWRVLPLCLAWSC